MHNILWLSKSNVPWITYHCKIQYSISRWWKQNFDSCLLKVIFCYGANLKGGRSLLVTLRLDLKLEYYLICWHLAHSTDITFLYTSSTFFQKMTARTYLGFQVLLFRLSWARNSNFFQKIAARGRQREVDYIPILLIGCVTMCDFLQSDLVSKWTQFKV